MLFLLGPLLYVVASVAEGPFLAMATGRLPLYVLTGKLFTEPFNTIHAGSALDQPTIGKWLLWFSVLTAFSVPLILLTRWLGDRSTRIGYWTFAIPVVIIGGLLLCVAMLPLCLLIQYVYWMGFTPNRVFGLSFGLAALIILPCFLRWTLRCPAGASPPGDNTRQQDAHQARSI
jgi:hypothetical protein